MIYSENMEYYKSNDSHFYKVDDSEGVLHVNTTDMIINIIHWDVFYDLMNTAQYNHAPLTKVAATDFVKAFDLVHAGIERLRNR